MYNLARSCSERDYYQLSAMLRHPDVFVHLQGSQANTICIRKNFRPEPYSLGHYIALQILNSHLSTHTVLFRI